MPRATIESLVIEAATPSTAHMAIALPSQTIVTATGRRIPFEISAENKEQLLLGLDEIAASERLLGQITEFESNARYCCPPIPQDL